MLLVLAIAAMINSMVANSSAPADTSSHTMTLMQPSTDMSPANMADSPEPAAATVSPLPDTGMSMSDCCGLLTLCVAMILGIGALALARLRRTNLGRVLWRTPRPHTFSLGRQLAPVFSSSPLQRTAVLRL